MVTIKASKFRTYMLKPYTSEINVDEKNDLYGFEIVAAIDGDDSWSPNQIVINIMMKQGYNQ